MAKYFEFFIDTILYFKLVAIFTSMDHIISPSCLLLDQQSYQILSFKNSKYIELNAPELTVVPDFAFVDSAL